MVTEVSTGQPHSFGLHPGKTVRFAYVLDRVESLCALGPQQAKKSPISKLGNAKP